MSADEQTLKPWTAEERENFFAAIERNRREAAYITIVGWCCSAMIAVVVAILMAPLVCGVVILVSDLVNLVVPFPDLVKTVVAHFQHAAHGTGKLPLSSWLALGALLAAPGLALMLLAIAALHRSLHKSPVLAGHLVPGRAPDPGVLAEQRLANVVSELSVAAALPTPEIRIAESPNANALAIGISAQAYTLVVTRPLLEALNREQLQGAIAHLIGSVADGDLAIGMRSTIHAALLAMVGNFTGGRSTVHEFGQLLLCAIRPGRIDASGFLAELEERRDAVRETTRARREDRSTDSKRTSMLFLIVAGPVMVQFFAGMTAEFLLKPLLALAWRRRKFMADATAVRLTRDPDALAGALEQFRDASEGSHAYSRSNWPTSVDGWVERFTKEPAQAAMAQRLIERSSVALAAMPELLRQNTVFAQRAEALVKQRDMVIAALERTKSLPQVSAALEAGALHGGNLDLAQNTGTTPLADRPVVPACSAHLALLTSRNPTPLMQSILSPVPSAERRLRALAKMGAHLRRAPRQMPLAARLILGALFAVMGGLMLVAVVLMVYVSAALSGLFTIIPILVLHMLLRWVGGVIHP